MFDVGDAGHVIVRGDTIKDTDEAVLEAVASCPTNALRIERNHGGVNA
jgi:ferredoxin